MGDRQTAKNEASNQRYSNLIYDSELFLTKLREFKPQSLGSLEARRKSSSTMIFPNPLQSCMGPPKCPRYPHNIKPTTGYWIECHGPGYITATNKTSSIHRQHHNQSNDLSGSFYLKSAEPGSSALSTSADFGHRSSGLQTSASQERFVTSSPLKAEYSDDLTDDSGPRPDSCCPTIAPKRQQSYDSASSELCLERRHRQTLNDDDECGDDGKQTTSDRYERVAGEKSSTGQITPAIDDNTINSASRAGNEQQTNDGPKTSRRRLTKRMMTRDDIDLHKPRRGTPNITITEPSFNQSTNTSHSIDRRKMFSALSKQVSQGGLTDSNRSSACSGGHGNVTGTSKDSPRLSLAGAQSSLDDGLTSNKADSFDCSKPLESISSDDESCRQSLMSMDLNEAELASSSRPQSANSYRNHSHHHHHHHSSINPYHRPSVIPEDIGLEQNDNFKTRAEDPSDIAYDNSHKSHEQGDYYCSLSTTTFHKQSFRQLTRQDQQDAVERFKDGPLELISFEEENYEKYYYGCEHWNYFTNDELLGPVMLSLKQEVNNQRDHFHVLLRTVSYTLHGTIPASTICADRYDREAIVRELSEIAKLKPPLMLAQLPSTPDDLLKLDRIFIKTELKVGVIYIKDGQAESEEAILGNKEESPLFGEFLDLLGDRITLKGFDKYKGGLDNVHNLTGTESVYTQWRNIEIMFHVSTMLPHEENDPQKLQKKRHIGNDIVCVAFIESDDMLFWPGCIKSWFLHTFITVQTSPKPIKEGEKRKYSVSCICRNEVQYAFKPYLVEKDEFYKSDCFREWLLTKIVNGERASYSAPKFARMQDRTRSQLLEDIITNLANHLMTGQIPKPYRRGSWRPLGHTRASSPLEDSMKDYFEDYDQLAKDYNNAFCGPNREMLCDVVFKVRDNDDNVRLVHGVRAVMAIRSRTFLEMLFGFVPPGAGGASSLQNQTSLRAIEMRALQGGDSSQGGNESSNHQQASTKNLLGKRGSFGADSGRKIEERERRQSMLPNLSKPSSQKPNYLTVPSTSSAGGVGAGQAGSSGTGGMIRNAFNRLVSGNWSGWSGNVKGYKGDGVLIKVDQNRKMDSKTLAICKEIAKFDSDKLSQREFEIKEFDYETFRQTIEYIHSGQCKLSYETIPGLICAAEHYDLHDLLHACFHHANTHMRLNAAPKMMNSLYQNSCFYVTAMQLLDSIYDYIDPLANEFFSRTEYLDLNESVLTNLLSRKTLQVSELKKFQAMQVWVNHQLTMERQKTTKQPPSQPPRQDSAKRATPRKISMDKQGSITQPPPSDEHQHEPELTTSPIIEPVKSESLSATTYEEPNDSIQNEHDQNVNYFDTQEYRSLLSRLVRAVNIKLDKISNEDIVKYILPTKVFSNDKIFEAMADESRFDY